MSKQSRPQVYYTNSIFLIINMILTVLTKHLFFLAFLIRLALILYGILGDRIWSLKYTDYDYKVYTDTSRYILEGKNPYDRITYRYTPLLAYILIPNFLLFYKFGKFLLVFFDIISVSLLEIILPKFILSK